MNETDRIIASLSDAELVLWHAKFGNDRLNNVQRARVLVLIGRIRTEEPGPDVFRIASHAAREREAERELETIYAA